MWFLRLLGDECSTRRLVTSSSPALIAWSCTLVLGKFSRDLFTGGKVIATDVDVLLNKHGCFSGKSDLSAAFGKNFKKGALGEETQYIWCIDKVGTRRSIVL